MEDSVSFSKSGHIAQVCNRTINHQRPYQLGGMERLSDESKIQNRKSKIKEGARALSSSFRDISRCAGSTRFESAPARPFPTHNLPTRQLFSDCWSGNGIAVLRDRKESARPVRNRAGPAATRV